MLILEFAATVERMSTSATSAGLFLASLFARWLLSSTFISMNYHSHCVVDMVREKIHGSLAIRTNIRKKLVARNTELLAKTFLNVECACS